MRSGVALPLLWLISASAVAALTGDPLVVGVEDHLLYDDYWTASSDGLQRVMHPPTKAGIVVKPEHPWEPIIFAYNSLVKVNDTDYRVYYDAIGCTDPTCSSGNGHRMVCVATSTDGFTFTKPSLGLVEFNGSKNNNMVLFPQADGKDAGQTYTVFLDTNPATPPSQRFVAFNDQVYFSADGFSFTPANSAHHLAFSDTQQAGYFDQAVGKYRIYFRTHNPGPSSCPGGSHSGRSIGMLTVANMSNSDWGPGDHDSGQANATIFNVDAGDNSCMDAYTSGAFKIADMYGMVPMMFLHCNGAATQRTTSCAYANADDKCDGNTEPLTCTEALRLNKQGCSGFGCKSADARCNTTSGTCETPSGAVCISTSAPPSSEDQADYPRTCNINPQSGQPDASDGPLEAQFAVSRDGRSFTRISRRPFVPRGRGKPRADPLKEGRYFGVWDGEFDSASTTVAVGTYEVGDMTVMMEAGWQYTHGGIDYALSPSTAPNHHPGMLPGGPVLSGLQLLTMRKHGFVSLRSSDDGSATGVTPKVGVWMTKPLMLPTCAGGEGLVLTLNAEAGIDGYVAASLKPTDAAQPVLGVPMIGNEVAHRVLWQSLNRTAAGDHLPAKMQGATASLVVKLQLADLYAFGFRCESDA